MTRFLPAKGDRVAHEQYGTGTITELDVYHTVIDFDAHGLKRFVTGRAVLERSSMPAPPPRERRAATPRRARGTRAAATGES
jgi:hypothetical protein